MSLKADPDHRDQRQTLATVRLAITLFAASFDDGFLAVGAKAGLYGDGELI